MATATAKDIGYNTSSQSTQGSTDDAGCKSGGADTTAGVSVFHLHSFILLLSVTAEALFRTRTSVVQIQYNKKPRQSQASESLGFVHL
jgi:hypothetical protein